MYLCSFPSYYTHIFSNRQFIFSYLFLNKMTYHFFFSYSTICSYFIYKFIIYSTYHLHILLLEYNYTKEANDIFYHLYFFIDLASIARFLPKTTTYFFHIYFHNFPFCVLQQRRPVHLHRSFLFKTFISQS